MDLPASVANKRLTAGLNPLDATLTKNRGYLLPAKYLSLSSRFPRFGGSGVQTFRRSGVRTRRRFNAFFIHSCRSLSKECLRTLLKSEGSALFLKTAGCMGLLPIPELASFTSHGPAPTLSGSPPLLHYSTHGTPTPRPTLPRRSPLARRDCSRHSRFAAFHRAAPAGRSTLLDRNWFWTR